MDWILAALCFWFGAITIGPALAGPADTITIDYQPLPAVTDHP